MYRCGRQAEALRHYEKVRLSLAEELGVDPSPPLRAVHRQLLVADPDTIAATRPASTPPEEALLERESLLDRLDDALAEAGTSGQVALIAGEAGIGKSALVRAFTRRHEHDLRFLVGLCDPLST